MAYNSLKDMIDFKKVDWEKVEKRATELWEYTNENLDIYQWEVNVRGYGRMSFLEFMSKCKKQFAVGRYIEASEAQTELLENFQPLILDVIKVRFADVFRALLNVLEEKKMTIDAVEEKLDESDDIVKKVMMENEILKEENEKLKQLNKFSNDGYYELWKIIEVKFDNLLNTYKDFDKINDEAELKSYIDAMKTELKVGIKPIEVKKNYLIKEQLKNLGFKSDDFIEKDKPKQTEEVEEVVEEEVEEIVKKPKIVINTDDFKEQLNQIKSNNDYIVPEEELKSNNITKYTTFKIHKGDIYDEQEWIGDGSEPMSEEEKEIRSKLIRNKFDGEEYMLESEVDYSDKSNNNKARVITLVELDLENTHTNFGVDSKQWIDRFKTVYERNLNNLEKNINVDYNPTVLKVLKKFENGKRK